MTGIVLLLTLCRLPHSSVNAFKNRLDKFLPDMDN